MYVKCIIDKLYANTVLSVRRLKSFNGIFDNHYSTNITNTISLSHSNPLQYNSEHLLVRVPANRSLYLLSTIMFSCFE